MEFAFANLKVSSKEGEAAILGLRKRGSHDVVAVESCPVASEALVPVLKTVRDWVARSGLLAWEPGGEHIENRVLRFLNTRTSVAGRGLAVELAVHNIQVNALLPGWIETDLNRERMRGALGEHARRKTPGRRLSRTDDLIGAAIFLASPASDFVTGVTLPVDGGYSIADRYWQDPAS